MKFILTKELKQEKAAHERLSTIAEDILILTNGYSRLMNENLQLKKELQTKIVDEVIETLNKLEG